MRIVVMGRTCAGKNEFLKELQKKGLTVYKTYTTRAKRYPKEDGYHFLSEEDLENVPEWDKFLKATVNGNEYFARKSDLIGGGAQVFMLEPSGLFELAGMVPEEQIILYYLVADPITRMERGMRRKAGAEEYLARCKSEDESFTKLEEMVCMEKLNPGTAFPGNVQVIVVENSLEGPAGNSVLSAWAQHAATSIYEDNCESYEGRKRSLNSDLYKVLFAKSQENWNKLFQLSHEEQVNNVYKYTVQQDIVSVLEEKDLEPEEAKALLSLKDPMRDIFLYWEEHENAEYLKGIRSAMEGLAAEIMGEKKDTPSRFAE